MSLPGDRALPLVRIQALASSVGRDFEAVSTQLHAAPAPCSFLAGVIEVQNALSTLADAIPIRFCEQLRRAVYQWSKQVFGLERFEP
jgi:hypothetical protein